MRINNKLIYQLSFNNQQHLKSIVDTLSTSNLSGEKYIINIFKKYGFNVIYAESNENINDDGVDLLLKYENDFFIIQIKFFLQRQLNYKEMKQYYGEMFLSKISLDILESFKKNTCVNYVLMCPFVSPRVNETIKKYKKYKFHLLTGDEFVSFLVNPKSLWKHKFNN